MLVATLYALTLCKPVSEGFHDLSKLCRDFPDGPVVRALRLHCGGCGFDPCAVQPRGKKQLWLPRSAAPL